MEDTTQKPQELFHKEYRELCEKHGMRIIARPEYKLRDDGTFSLVILFEIAQLPAKT